MSDEVEDLPDWREGKSEEEQARILLAAKETKSMIIAVAGVAVGGIVFMVLITILIVALRYS